MNVYMSARTQFSNLGDLVINKAFILVMLLDDKVNVTLDMTGVPKNYEKLLIEALPLSRVSFKRGLSYYSSLIRKIARRQKVAVILKPGGYVASNSMPMKLRRMAQGILLHAYNLAGAIIIRAPSSQSPSCGFDRIIDKFRFSPVSTVFIRDSISLANLTEIGIVGTEVCDLAEMLFDENIFNKVFHERDVGCDVKEKIAFSFREREGLSEVDFNQVSPAELTPIYVSQVVGDSSVKNGNTFLTELCSVEYDVTAESAMAIMNEYSQSKFVVSNRLHSLILGLVSGAIPVAIVTDKDEKVSSMMIELGFEKNIFRLEKTGMVSLKSISDLDQELDGFNLEVMRRIGSSKVKILGAFFRK